MFYVTSEIYLNNDLGSLAVSVDNYPQKRKNHLTITYIADSSLMQLLYPPCGRPHYCSTLSQILQLLKPFVVDIIETVNTDSN